MRYQPHTHNHTTSRRQQQANLALRSPQGKLQILGVFPRYRLPFREKHYLCPEKTNAMNAKTHLKAIANPHIQHQRIANSLERGLGKQSYQNFYNSVRHAYPQYIP